MSSRIYARTEGKPAEPFAWPSADGSVPASIGGDPADPQARRALLERDVEWRVQEARKAGVQEGIASGKAAAAAEIKALNERVAKTVAELADFRPRLRRQAEADLLKLALAIARRIIHRELAVDAEAMRGLIQAALDKLQSQEIYRVRIHPSQEPVMRAMLAETLQGRKIEFHADPKLDRGAALFETTRGNLDASVETQLREIEQGLADRLERSS